MKFGKAFLCTAVISILWASSVFAQIYNYSTIAGTPGTSGSMIGLGTIALFNNPTGVVADNSGNLYVVDFGNSTIDQIFPVSGNWFVTTIAGTAGTTGTNDDIGANALFDNPVGIAIDDSNNLYVADYGNSTIRQIISIGGVEWVVTTIAGTGGTTGSGDGFGYQALFDNPISVAVDSTGNVYVADYGNNTIREITPVESFWVVTTIAGKAGKSGSVNGTNSAARFNGPAGVAVDSAGNVYVADYGDDTIREITPVGTNWVVSTIAGLAGKSGSADGTNSTARFHQPFGLSMDASNNLYVADSGNNTIRKITPVGTNWVVSTIGGLAGKSGSTDGTGSTAHFRRPDGVTTDSSGNVYVADTDNDTIRRGIPSAATFVPLQGTYNGLAIQTNAPSQLSSGSLKLVLAETGSFTANLTMAGTRRTFAGQFDQNGNVTNLITGGGSIVTWVILSLDLTNGTEEITGTVSNNLYQSELVADLATFSKANGCPQTGVYTFVVMPPSVNDSTLPQGWGYGTLKVAATGTGSFSGTLGDGTKLSGTVPVSKYGTAPLYSELYGNKGAFVGWLSFTNDTIESTMDWFRPAVTSSHYFAGGFTTNTELLASKYVAPAKGESLIDLTNTAGNAILAIGGGDLGGTLSNAVTIATNNTVTILSGTVTNLKLSVASKTGTFSGSFLQLATHKTVKFQGAVLQSQDFGAGFFTGTNATGFVTITPVE